MLWTYILVQEDNNNTAKWGDGDGIVTFESDGYNEDNTGNEVKTYLYMEVLPHTYFFFFFFYF